MNTRSHAGSPAMLPLDPTVWLSPWLDWSAALTIAAFFPTALWHRRQAASSE